MRLRPRRALAAALALGLMACAAVPPVPAPSPGDPASPDAPAADSAPAAAARPLDEESAVMLALARNPRVVASYERLGVARADVLQAAKLRNPSLRFEAYVFSGGTEVEGGLMAPLFSLFEAPLRRARAEADLAAASAEVRGMLVGLTFDVRRAALNLRAAEEVAALRRTDAEVAAESLHLARKLDAAGNATPPFMARAELAAAEARRDADDVALAAELAREPLNRLAGLFGPEAAAWRLAPRAKAAAASRPATRPATRPDVESAAVAASFDLARLSAEADRVAQDAGAESFRSTFEDGEFGAVGRRAVDGEGGFGPAATLTLPVFDDGSTATERGAAKLRETLALRSALGVDIRSAARTFARRAAALESRAAHVTGTIAPLEGRVLVATLAEYNAMQIGAFDVMAARRAELRAQESALVARRDADEAALDLSELTAGVLRRERLRAADGGEGSDGGHGSRAPDMPAKGH